MGNEINRLKLAQLGNLEFLAKQVVEGFITGLHKSPFHGFSVEFGSNKEKHSEFGEIEQYAVNLNDGSNEGISIWESNAYSVQFHPDGFCVQY